MAGLTVATAREPQDSGRLNSGILGTMVSGSDVDQSEVAGTVSGSQHAIIKGTCYSDGSVGAETLLIQSANTTIATLFLPAEAFSQPLPEGIFTVAGEALNFKKSAANQTVSIWVEHVPVAAGQYVPQLG